MSNITRAIKNRSRINREAERQRVQSIKEVKASALYRMRLNEDLNIIDTIFEDETVKEIKIAVAEKDIKQFMEATFSTRMADYEITQMPGYMTIRRKMVSFN